MDAIFDLIGKVFNPILEMGGPVIMLIILTVLALLFGVKFSKALEGGIKLAIALASATLVVMLALVISIGMASGTVILRLYHYIKTHRVS
ncbi:PTS system galactitol-specific family transporter subunit IIC [Streptococcus pneumoniae]|nr:PTS system galactitol-specific family transporter subunit IIC [Streptococcus pneumoniae]